MARVGPTEDRGVRVELPRERDGSCQKRETVVFDLDIAHLTRVIVVVLVTVYNLENKIADHIYVYAHAHKKTEAHTHAAYGETGVLTSK